MPCRIGLRNGGIHNYCVRFVAVAGIGVVISTVLYRWVELPFQRLAKNVIARWGKRDRSRFGLFVKKTGKLYIWEYDF